MSEPLIKSSISVVVPVRNDGEKLLVLLETLESQTVLPHELIVVDSSDESDLQDQIQKRLDESKTSYIYKKIQGSYAGKSMNIGAELASGDYLAFLDTQTIPEISWIDSRVELFEYSTLDVVFGKTIFRGGSWFQKLIKAASYGSVPHETVPGTVIRRTSWGVVGGFSETVRATYDVEWRDKVKKLLNFSNAGEACITYEGFPRDLITTTKKYILYSFHAARTEAKNHIKQSYLTLFLILLALVIPRWNHIISGWESNPLYIPHVTKIFVLAVVFLFFLLIGVERLFAFVRINLLVKYSFKWIVVIFVSLGVYSWNGVAANAVETATYYIPHVTKLYLAGAAIIFVVVNGIVLPIRKKESLGYLFPYNWFMIALLRFYLDVIKAPGYIFGAIICIFRSSER